MNTHEANNVDEINNDCHFTAKNVGLAWLVKQIKIIQSAAQIHTSQHVGLWSHCILHHLAKFVMTKLSWTVARSFVGNCDGSSFTFTENQFSRNLLSTARANFI